MISIFPVSHFKKYVFIITIFMVSLLAQGCTINSPVKKLNQKPTSCMKITPILFVPHSDWVVINERPNYDRERTAYIYDLKDPASYRNENEIKLNSNELLNRNELMNIMINDRDRYTKLMKLREATKPKMLKFAMGCPTVNHLEENLKFITNIPDYGIVSKGDICDPKPNVKILFTKYLSYEEKLAEEKWAEEEFLTKFYTRWNKSHNITLNAIKSLMWNKCKAMAKSIGVEGGILVKSGENTNNQPVKSKYVFKEIYSGKIALYDIRENLDEPIRFPDLLYSFVDDYPEERLFYIEKELERLREIHLKKAQYEADRYHGKMKILSFFHGYMQGVSLNFSDEIMCSLAPNYRKCHDEYNQKFDQYKANYSNWYKTGNFLGLILTPTETLYHEEIRNTPRGRANIEAIEGVLSEIGESRNFREISVERMFINAIVGGVVGSGIAEITKKGN